MVHETARIKHYYLLSGAILRAMPLQSNNEIQVSHSSYEQKEQEPLVVKDRHAQIILNSSLFFYLLSFYP
jgi:hypothetical protein